MAFAGKSEKKENITAAVAANIWMSNERGARAALPDENLSFIVLDCVVSKEFSLVYDHSRGSGSSTLKAVCLLTLSTPNNLGRQWVKAVCEFKGLSP